jgi:peptidyl-prolyl cis-trans isomerase B (cyclophilin B)
MHLLAGFALLLVSVLTPTKNWFAPDQPLTVNIKAEGDSHLVLTNFTGAKVDPKGAAEVSGEASKDLKQIFPEALAQAGTYLLYVVPKGKDLPDFEGTPLVISVREDKRRAAPPGPMVIKVEPLQYAVMSTKQGNMTMAFYYDVAPHTAENFLDLASHGYFDGLKFHRIVPGFVIQGGDPRGDGTGGPGYQIPAEFNERPHVEGVLSMARGPEFDSAGSQFFVCLDYAKTQQLDRKYTAFGKVVDGFDAAKEIAKAKLVDERAGKPEQPPVIEKVEVKPVTAKENPYTALQQQLTGAKPEGKGK